MLIQERCNGAWMTLLSNWTLNETDSTSDTTEFTSVLNQPQCVAIFQLFSSLTWAENLYEETVGANVRKIFSDFVISCTLCTEGTMIEAPRGWVMPN